MRLVSILIVTFALLLAGAIFFVVPRLMTRGSHEAQQQQAAVQLPTSDVLVATQNLPAGAVLKSEDLRWQRWPQDALDPSFLVRDKGADLQRDAVGHVVLHGIEKGAPVTAARLLKPGEAGFLAAALAPGLRAVAVKVDPVTDVAGFVLPSDRVDVLLTEHYSVQSSNDAVRNYGAPQIGSKDVTSVVLRNLKVLGIDQVMQDIDSKPKLVGAATLEVDLAQAEKLALAAQIGTLSLVLRSHAAPEQAEADVGAQAIEDVQVSPVRGAVLMQQAAILGQNAGGAAVDPGTMPPALRVYHGASLARAAGQ
jgi:pilus assembly protein CpaB